MGENGEAVTRAKIDRPDARMVRRMGGALLHQAGPSPQAGFPVCSPLQVGAGGGVSAPTLDSQNLNFVV